MGAKLTEHMTYNSKFSEVYETVVDFSTINLRYQLRKRTELNSSRRCRLIKGLKPFSDPGPWNGSSSYSLVIARKEEEPQYKSCQIFLYIFLHNICLPLDSASRCSTENLTIGSGSQIVPVLSM